MCNDEEIFYLYRRAGVNAEILYHKVVVVVVGGSVLIIRNEDHFFMFPLPASTRDGGGRSRNTNSGCG